MRVRGLKRWGDERRVHGGEDRAHVACRRQRWRWSDNEDRVKEKKSGGR